MLSSPRLCGSLSVSPCVSASLSSLSVAAAMELVLNTALPPCSQRTCNFLATTANAATSQSHSAAQALHAVAVASYEQAEAEAAAAAAALEDDRALQV